MTGRLHLCYSSICYWPQILQFPKINELMDLYSKYWGLPISGYCVWRFLQLSMVKTFVCGKLWNARAPLMTSVLMFQLVFFLSDVPFICGDVCPQVPVFSGRSRPLLCPSLHSFPSVRMKLYNWHNFPSPLPCGPTPCCVSRTFIGWTQILSIWNVVQFIFDPNILLGFTFQKCCFSHSEWMLVVVCTFRSASIPYSLTRLGSFCLHCWFSMYPWCFWDLPW